MRVASLITTAAALTLIASAASADIRNNVTAQSLGTAPATFDLEDGEKHQIYHGSSPATYRICNVGKAHTMQVVTDKTQEELDPGDCWDTEATGISATNQGSLPADARVEGTFHRVLGTAN